MALRASVSARGDPRNDERNVLFRSAKSDDGTSFRAPREQSTSTGGQRGDVRLQRLIGQICGHDGGGIGAA